MPETAAIREVYEETGVTVAIDGLLGLYAEPHSPVLLIAYYGHSIDGIPEAKDEVEEIGLFTFEGLPDLDSLPHDNEILKAYQAITDRD